MAQGRLEIIADIRDNVSRRLNGMQRSVQSVGKSFAAVGAQFAGIFGAGALVKGIVETNAEFDKLEAQIATFTGSSEEAASAMKLIQDITSQTPFQLNEVTTAFTRMKALGLNPTKEALLAFGDVAAGSGKSILQFTEAVADAAVGEFERLKEFGIKASAQGDQVAFTFKGVTTTVKKNSMEIQNYLTELGQNNFGGAMAKQMDTMAGAWSNAKDQFALLARAIGEAGLNDLIKGIAQAMGAAARAILDNMDVIKGTWANIVSTVSKGIEYLRHGFVMFTLRIKQAWFVSMNAISEAWSGFLNFFIEGYNEVADFVGANPIELSQSGFAENVADIDAAIAKEQQYHDGLMDRLEESRKAKIEKIQTDKAAADAVKDYSEYEQANAEAIAKSTAATQADTKAKKEKLTVYDKLMENIKNERVETEQTWEAMEKLDDAFQSGAITSEEYAKGLKELEKNLGAVADESKKTVKETKKVETVFSKTMKSIKENRKEVSETQSAITLLNEAYKNGEITYREYTDAMKQYENTLYSAGDATGELLHANSELENSFTELFDDIIRGSDDVRGSLRKLIASFVEYIFAANNASTASPFTSVSGGNSSGFLSGIGDFISGAVSGIGDFFGGFFADGGYTDGRAPIVVGERGPELFMPSTSGNIIPNGSFGMGGPVNFNISALDGADVMRVLTQNRREISELVSGTSRTYGLV